MGDFTKLDDLLTGFAGKTLPGCACVIRKGNEILHESYAGWADIEQKTAVDRESVFRQASTTKLFTYAIMGMLYEEGKFLFSDPVSEYLPEWRHTVRWQHRENRTIELVPLEHSPGCGSYDVRPAVLHVSGSECGRSDCEGHE